MHVDRDKWFLMSEKDFDDSPEGWRSLDNGTEEGYIAAAELIEAYIKEVEESSYLWFHAGQCLASAGESYYSRALSCFKESVKNNHSEQVRLYRLATIAFLQNRPQDVRKLLEEMRLHRDPSNLVGILESMVKQLSEDGRPDYNKMYDSV